jgi:hypothetical protein
MPEKEQPKLEFMSPDALDFDDENPRFGGELKGKSQLEIQKAIFGAPYYASELVDSFLENGFISYEPLIVKRHGSKHVVVEGNRRLAAIKEIRANLEKYPQKKSDLHLVPVIVFPELEGSKAEQQVRVYLGIRHLLGFREWPPLAKAEFLERESQKPGGLDQIIKEVRITKQQVRRFLVPFRLLNDAKIKLPQGEDFWVLGEALQRSGVKKFIQLDVDSSSLEILGYDKANLKLVLEDLYGNREASAKSRDPIQRRVHDTRDLSTYASVLSSEKAASVLHAGKALNEASIYVDTREQSQTRLSRIAKELGLLIRKLMQQDKSDEAIAVSRSFKELDSAVRAYLKKHAKSNV